MADARRLSSMDAAFLHLETPEMPMHVGSIAIFQPPRDYNGDFYEDFKAQFAERLHLAPTLQDKLARPLLDIDNPSWVPDEQFNIDRHLFRASLPEPANRASLERIVGWMHAKLLNRARPLWEFYIFDGLEGGEVAVYSKVHHAMIDGGAGVALSKIIYDISPNPRPIRAKDTKKAGRAQSEKRRVEVAAEALDAYAQVWVRPLHGSDKPPVALPRTGRTDLGSVLLDHAMMQMETSLKLVAHLPTVLKTAGGVLGGMLNADVLKRVPDMIPPRTPINRSISSERSFATLTLSMSRAKALAKAAGGKLNDVVLALCSGMLRQLMLDMDALPKKSMTASCPISLREPGDAATTNQVFAMNTSLCTDVADPRARLEKIIVEAGVAKAMVSPLKDVVPHVQHLSVLGAPMAMQVMSLLFSRSNLADVVPMGANVIISNVQGPPMTLYAAGAELKHNFPVSIATHGMSLNITVQSYKDLLDFGLIAGANVLPDLQKLARLVENELDVLEASFGLKVAEPA
jgi:diacylglycerol O-acyltransferase / wax synthase